MQPLFDGGAHAVTRRRGRRVIATSLAIAAATVGLVVGAQRSDPHDPAPWTCSPISRTHPCKCHRMDDDPMCEGTVYHEDAKCSRYCEPKKCQCPVHCKES